MFLHVMVRCWLFCLARDAKNTVDLPTQGLQLLSNDTIGCATKSREKWEHWGGGLASAIVP